MKILTKEKFIERANIVHTNKYNYSKVNYINGSTKVIVVCLLHGEFLQRPNSHLNGQNCPKCWYKHNFSVENFIQKAKKIYGDKYDYSKINYVNTSTNIIIVCPKHGEFSQRPNNHLRSLGCPKCSNYNKSLAQKHTMEEFIWNAKEIHGNIYDYSKINYINTQIKIDIICSKHGKFSQRPNEHLRGSGCPLCSESQGEKKVAEILRKSNILFERQVTFGDLKDKSNLYYDFYLSEYKLFIEYDGKQHYESTPFFGGEDALLKTRKHDIIKYKYAVNNGYKILIIRFIPPKYLEELLNNKLKEILPLCVA